MVVSIWLAACAGSSADLQTAIGPAETETSALKVPRHGEGKTPSADARKAVTELTAAATPGNGAYLVGPLDMLDITVFKAPELTRSVQVADTGTINMPLVGEVQAAGRTAHAIEIDLAAKLGARYLQHPQVSVLVKEFNSQRVTLEGAVRKPGVYPLRGGMTLLQLVATAEGFGDASDATVLVFRAKDGKRMAARFDVDDIRSGKALDPPLQSGDVVVAPASAMKESLNAFLKVLPIAGVFALVL